MTASLSPDSIPPHATICWVDDNYVYTAIPTTAGGLPYISKFPLSESGLSKALNMLRIRYDELPSALKNYTAQSAPPSNSKIQTPAQRDHALAVLRKLRIV